MNDYTEMEISKLESRVNRIERTVTQLKMDKQLFIEKNNKLKPGIASKVAYDYNGLITGTEKLSAEDIPPLPMSKIQGLEDVLSTKAGVGDINKLKAKMFDTIKAPVANTGCKVNIDANGHVVSTTELLPEDIPELPISKITGLSDMIELIYNQPVTEELEPVIEHMTLSMDDIPNDLIKRINRLELELSNVASKKSVQELADSMNNKVGVSHKVEPGIYTKVVVDSNGMIVNGDNISKKDLPETKIEDIDGLKDLIESKADQTEVDIMMNTLNTIMSSLNKITDIGEIKKEVEAKASKTELANIKRDIKEIREAVDRLSRVIR